MPLLEDRPVGRRWRTLISIVVIFALLAAFAWFLYTSNRSSASPQRPSAVTVTTAPAASTASAGQVTTPSPAPSVAPTEPATSAVDYLADLQPHSGSILRSTGPSRINGTDYPKSVLTKVVDCAGVLSTANIEYTLERRYTRFSATLGLDERSAAQSVVDFQLYGDGKPLLADPVELAIDQNKAVDVDLTGVFMLKISATIVTKSPLCQVVARPAWGDASLTRAAQ
jgi:hypothetical protein